MSNSVLYLTSTLKTTILPDELFFYNQVQISSDQITYDSVTGMISLLDAGTYLFNWNLTFSTAAPGQPVHFSLVNGTSEYQTTVLQRDSQLVGTALITVEQADLPVMVSLKNTGTICYFSPELNVTGSMTVVNVSDTSTVQCLSYQQTVYVLEQLITLYPTANWQVFIPSLYSYTGMLGGLSGGGSTEPGLLIITDGTDEVRIPIDKITAVALADGTYDDSISYLPMPQTVPQNCITNIMQAIADYVPVGTDNVGIVLGVNTTASGMIHKNEAAMLVLSDSEGNTPIFIPTMQIQQINKPLNVSGKRASGVSISNRNP